MTSTTSRARQPTALFRLTVRNPVVGAIYSLQGKDGVVVDVRKAAGGSLVFEIPVRIVEHVAGPRVLGDFVRTEGKSRRFFYLASGQQAGEANANSAAGEDRLSSDHPDPP